MLALADAALWKISWSVGTCVARSVKSLYLSFYVRALALADLDTVIKICSEVSK